MKNKRKIIISLICVIIAIVIGVILIYKIKFEEKSSIDKKWEIKEVYFDLDDIDYSSAVMKHWDELSITQKFSKCKYNNIDYYNTDTEVEEYKIEQFLSEVILNGKDNYTLEEHSINAKVFKLKDVSAKCTLAIQFENNSNYYIYINSNYTPETLGQFIRDLNLKNTIFKTTVNYNQIKDEKVEKEIEFEKVDSNIIWEMLFSDDTSKFIDDNSKYHQSVASIPINNPFSKYDRYSINLSIDGYLSTNIFESQKTFYIGEEKVNKFLNYLIDECKGYEIVYVNKDKNENLSEENEGTIMMYDIKNNTTTEVNMNNINNDSNSTYASSNFLETYNSNE